MDQMNETAAPELDAGEKKKKKLPRILGVILIILAPFLAAAALMPRDSAPEEAPSAFDPYSGTEARQYLEFNMLTDPVATFTLGENHGIYVAFQADDTGLYPYLVCLSQADFDRFSEIYEFTFDGILRLNMQKFMLENGTQLIGRAALLDTMKDLIVDCLGAFIMSFVGYLSLRYKTGFIEKLQLKWRKGAIKDNKTT